MMHKDLKVGDEVLIKRKAVLLSGGWMNGRGCEATYIEAQKVARVTSTQATTVAGIRFRLADGKVIGACDVIFPVGYVDPDRLRLRPPMKASTPEQMDNIRYAQMAARELTGAIEKLTNGRLLVLKDHIVKNGLAESVTNMYALATAIHKFVEGGR